MTCKRDDPNLKAIRQAAHKRVVAVLRCELVVDVVDTEAGRRLVRCGNPARHRLPDGTPLCREHWLMSAEGKRTRG